MNKCYFSNIDSKEKAYWLGFLFADGYVSKNGRRVSLCLGLKDKTIIERFLSAIDFKECKIRYYGRYEKSGESVQISITCPEMVSDLIKLGCVNRKSLIVRFPTLGCDDFNMAFLLGYFDGNGATGTARIASGSRLFLDDVKNTFGIERPITNGSGKTLYLYLGQRLFIAMLENYEYSLGRKRVLPKSYKIKNGKYVFDKSGGIRKIKFDVSPEKLRELVWIMPTTKVAKLFNVTDVAIAKRCRLLGIVKPSLGYWAKTNNQHRPVSALSYKE